MCAQKQTINTANVRIVADRQIPIAQALFSKLGTVFLHAGRSITPATINDADLLLVRSTTTVDATLLKDSRVRFIGSATSGIDHVDLPYLAERGIDFAHAPGSNARAVAEYVLSCLCALDLVATSAPTEITIGIIGCGRVGAVLRRFLGALGFNCLINDPPLQDKAPGQQYCALDDVAQAADIISLHVPLTETGQYPTYHMIEADFLARCKPHATLINTARGAVIDQHALPAHMKKNPGFTVVCDTWKDEPNIDRELLAKARLATPHIAGYSLDGKIAATKMLYHAATLALGLGVTDPLPAFVAADPDVIQTDAAAVLRSAILSSYDVRADSLALKKLLQLAPAQAGAYFDALRKNYPVRRDFTAHTVRLAAADVAQKSQLQCLGFTIDR